MNHRKTGLTWLSAIVALALILVACNRETAQENSAGVTEVLAREGLSTFNDIYKQNALNGPISGASTGELTLFAPTNEAFRKFFEDNEVDFAGLAEVLSYHSAPGRYPAARLAQETSVPTLQGSSIAVAAEGGTIVLNGSARVLRADIGAFRVLIHIIDEVLEIPPPEETVTFSSEPNLMTVEGSAVSDTISVDDPRFLQDLSVTIDLEHPFINDVSVLLTHEETGKELPLIIRPRSNRDNARLTLSDAAELSVQDDVIFEGLASDGEAYDAETYRPARPLVLSLGESLAGNWRLDISDGGIPGLSEDLTGKLLSWSLSFSAVAVKPPPAIYIEAKGTNLDTVTPGAREDFAFFVERLSGLEGPVTLGLEGGAGLSATPMVIPEGVNEGFIFVSAAEDAPLGEQSVSVSATSGSARQLFALDLNVADFKSDNTELLAYLPLADMGAQGAEGNDIWGWTDPETGKEYALMGTTVGTSFVDVSVPQAPVFLGTLPTHTDESVWRDIKVYKDHAFIVSEADDHGMQVFDLTQLRAVSSPQKFTETAHYGEFGNAHNIVIDEASGYAYAVGATDESYARTCFGGLFMIDIRTPAQPEFAGCFAGGVPAGETAGEAYPTDVYVHDAHCVVYDGPDKAYKGREICVTSDGQLNASSADFVAVADVTDKAAPVQLSRASYPGDVTQQYAHQGWLTEDHAYFLFNDEADEQATGVGTTTLIWDLRDLDSPKLLGEFINPSDAIGHNAYTKDGYLYQANYTSGLRVTDLADVAGANLSEVAFFDTYPEDDVPLAALRAEGERCSSEAVESAVAHYNLHNPETPKTTLSADMCAQAAIFNGVWSNYPYFESGIVVLSDIDRGLFVVRPELP